MGRGMEKICELQELGAVYVVIYASVTPHIRKFQVNPTFIDFTAQSVSKLHCVPSTSLITLIYVLSHQPLVHSSIF